VCRKAEGGQPQRRVADARIAMALLGLAERLRGENE
jgi:hypothetical protein